MSKTITETIAETVNLHDYENLRERLGIKLGQNLYVIVGWSEKADKELGILHDLVTALYNIDQAVPQIKEALDKIEKL